MSVVSTVVVTPPAGESAPDAPKVGNSSSSAAAGLPTPMTPNTGVQVDPDRLTETASSSADSPERPAGLPSEFNSMEDFTAAWEAMKAGKTGASPSPNADPVKTITEATKAAGVDFDAIAAEYHKTGAISEEHYQALEKAGISRQFMNAAVAGQQAAIQAELADIYSVVGGRDKFGELQSWAAVNLSEDEKQALNDVVDSQPASVVKIALSGLHARYQAANGSEPNLIGGSASNAPAGSAFQSIYQITQAMSDPRYANDPSYRADVERRLAVTTVL